VTRRFLIDTDTASDDAVALVMALREPSVTVDAITVVAGNVGVEQALQNAVYTVELCGLATPVHKGLAGPIMRDLVTAQHVHGADGMGDIGLPLFGYAASPGRAVDVIVDTILASPGEITLVTLGPLSNVAAALLRAPEIAGAVEHCYIMGGTGAGHGNVSPMGEFNFWCDPEAAAVVMRSGMPMTLIGWDISVRSATFGPEDAARLRACGPMGEFAVDIQSVLTQFALTETKLVGFDLPDPIAMAVAIDPGMATSVWRHVEIACGNGPARGHDIVDWLGATGRDPNAHIVTEVPRTRFVELLERLLR
jgi:purine nucleosidase